MLFFRSPVVTSYVSALASALTTLLVCGSLFMFALTFAGCKSAPTGDVVATVNGHPIMRSEMKRLYEDEMGQAQPQESPSEEQEDSRRLQLLSQLILGEIIEQRAAKMNLTATSAEVDAKLGQFKAPYTEEQFQKQLAGRHTTVDEIKIDLRRSITVDKLLNKEINLEISISEADIAHYFNSHKTEFNNDETQYHLAQLLVTNNVPPQKTGPINLQNSKTANDDNALKKIQALKNRIDSGEDFGTLAMNFSENEQNSASGGDMGTFAESQLMETSAIYNAIAKLKPGQTTDIIPIPDPTDPRKANAYMILQLITKEPAGIHNLSEPQVQQRIRQGLHDSRSQVLKAAYFELLRDQANVHNFLAERIFTNFTH